MCTLPSQYNLSVWSVRGLTALERQEGFRTARSVFVKKGHNERKWESAADPPDRWEEAIQNSRTKGGCSEDSQGPKSPSIVHSSSAFPLLDLGGSNMRNLHLWNRTSEYTWFMEGKSPGRWRRPDWPAPGRGQQCGISAGLSVRTYATRQKRQASKCDCASPQRLRCWLPLTMNESTGWRTSGLVQFSSIDKTNVFLDGHAPYWHQFGVLNVSKSRSAAPPGIMHS